MVLKEGRATEEIIGAAIEVHKVLGPGLLESAYEECLCHELRLRKIPFKRQVPVSVDYKGVKLECAYRIDVLVAGKIIVELKTVEKLKSVHKAQLLTYMKIMESPVGLLLNFNEKYLKDGLVRTVL
jgi:GxxExxY protein